ncbi:unnamed protein product [Nezara viridula]|uniref:Uncharacterized protein n=1 Tax=Nezara viridula TaxID=85310 RepID=A0A9P0MUN1_NEZVI|nr:unnamed protein product [Nezara viridula]
MDQVGPRLQSPSWKKTSGTSSVPGSPSGLSSISLSSSSCPQLSPIKKSPPLRVPRRSPPSSEFQKEVLSAASQEEVSSSPSPKKKCSVPILYFPPFFIPLSFGSLFPDWLYILSLRDDHALSPRLR